MKLLRLAVVLVLFVAAGCGGDEATPTETVTTTETVTNPNELELVRVYFLRDGKVWPVGREVEIDRTGPAQAVRSRTVLAVLDELRQGPTDSEASDLGVSTALPDVVALATAVNGVVRFDADPGLSERGVAQVVYTLTQFPSIEGVEVDGRRVTRADFEDLTPAILVELPLPFEEVDSPLRVTGSANTFEANFQYELTDTDGRIVDENFVTATSGTGTRGTFEFTTEEYEVPFDGAGSLIVFEASAKDGSRINLVEIPLRMTKD